MLFQGPDLLTEQRGDAMFGQIHLTQIHAQGFGHLGNWPFLEHVQFENLKLEGLTRSLTR